MTAIERTVVLLRFYMPSIQQVYYVCRYAVHEGIFA